jgi:hypothetical protein
MTTTIESPSVAAVIQTGRDRLKQEMDRAAAAREKRKAEETERLLSIANQWMHDYLPALDEVPHSTVVNGNHVDFSWDDLLLCYTSVPRVDVMETCENCHEMYPQGSLRGFPTDGMADLAYVIDNPEPCPCSYKQPQRSVVPAPRAPWVDYRLNKEEYDLLRALKGLIHAETPYFPEA